MVILRLSDVISSASKLFESFDPNKLVPPLTAVDRPTFLAIATSGTVPRLTYPCDGEVFDKCLSRTNAVPLNPANHLDFTQFSNGPPRLVLFYSTVNTNDLAVHFMDHFTSLGEKNLTMVEFVRSRGTFPHLVGSVNCDTYPSLCRSMFYYDGVRTPRFVTSSDLPFLVQYFSTSQSNLTGYSDSALKESDDPVYDSSASACLWQRYGAGMIESSLCRQHMEQKEHEKLPSSHELNNLQRGKVIAGIWNFGLIAIAIILSLMMCAVSWRLCKRCFNRVSLIKSSINMTKTERKAQLEQQRVFFLSTALVAGLVNMFLPMLMLAIGGPIAVLALMWIWKVELNCCCGVC